MVKKALLIAYHYPPVKISSGVQRTLAFSQYLRNYAWEPIVLTVNPKAYQIISKDQLNDIPDDIIVKRAFALDTGQHLAVFGRYLSLMALPDRWITWWFGGVVSGMLLIRKHHPAVIWSTYPIATAHLIGLTLSRLTGIPWVADFRDSMIDQTYPQKRTLRWFHRSIERRVIKACRFAVFTTPGAVHLYKERYPDISADRFRLIPNGYNEEIFLEVERENNAISIDDQISATKKPMVLVHSGVIYPEERDPKAFFEAIADLKKTKHIDAGRLRIILRATGHDEAYRKIITDLCIADIIELAPGIDYRAALKEMMLADGLLIFQASNCNHQIPAKLYEYFRARKPILALTDKAGDTAVTLKFAGVGSIAPLDNVQKIRESILDFVGSLEEGVASVAEAGVIEKYSRKYAARELAELFAEVMS